METEKSRRFWFVGYINKDTPVLGMTHQKLEEILRRHFDKQFAELRKRDVDSDETKA